MTLITPRSPIDLRVGGRREPLGIETTPAFSWDPRVATQAAYELEVREQPSDRIVWSPGRRESPTNVAVPYEGPALCSATRYTWRVRIWDDNGSSSPWSDFTAWEMGLSRGADWDGASWIGGRTNPDHDWTDIDATIVFCGGGNPVDGLRVLFHAEPLGKTWGEAYQWVLGVAPRLDARLSEPAVAGSSDLYLDDLANLATGDRIVIALPDAGAPHDSALEATVEQVGMAAVDSEVAVPFGASIVFLRDRQQLLAGEPIDVGGTTAAVVSATHGHGGTILVFTPPVQTVAGTPVSRSGRATRLCAALARDVPAGAAVSGSARLRLAMATRHWAGNTGVPDGEPAVEWGRNTYDQQAVANPIGDGVRLVPLGEVDLSDHVGLTPANWTEEHSLGLRVRGNRITTTIDGMIVDERTVSGDEVRPHGSFGFDGGTTALIRSVTLTTPDGDPLVIDASSGENPFESGIPSAEGLRVGRAAAMLPMATPAPLLRTRITVPDRPIRRARLFISAAGQHEFTIDGHELTIPDPVAARGDVTPRLLPDHTSSDRTVLYHAFDVTPLVAPGREAVLAVELGRGWYGVTTPTEWYWHLSAYNGQPRLLAKLLIEHEDGGTTTITTDEQWETADGPTRFDSVYSGEKYDARVAEQLGDWRRGASSPLWSAASVLARPGSARGGDHHGALPADVEPDGFIPARVRGAELEPVVLIERRRPVSAIESSPGSGVWIVDFGQILTGFPSLHLRDVSSSAAGATVRFRGGNLLTGDGTASSPLEVEHENTFHDADLQTHYYTVGSASDQSWTPRLTHWGFRYIEVRGLGSVLTDSPLAADGAFSVEVARNGFPRTARFTSDSPLLARITANAEWSEQNNLLHKPTDTPSREKNGWSGDAMASSESELITWGTAPFFTKYLRDVIDAQADSGQIPMILPAVMGGYGYAGTPGWNSCWQAVPTWDAALFVMPWELYLYSGDPSILAEVYPTQRRLLAYYETLFLPEQDYRFEAALGEYSGSGDPGSNAAISLQMYILFADRMAEVGKLLGEFDVAHWDRLSGELRRAFIRQYWLDDSGRFQGGQLESTNILALEFDLVPGGDLAPDDPRYRDGSASHEQNRCTAAAAVADSIRDHGFHAQMGVYGARFAFNVLEEFGYTDLLMRSVTVADAPGFASQIAQGATSLWESWEGGSRNHHYRSNVTTWFLQELGGIAPLTPGYAEFRVRPRFPLGDDYLRGVSGEADHADCSDRGPLTRVRVEVASPHGEIVSSWHRDGETVHLTVTVPSNTVCELWCPADNDDAVDIDDELTRVSNTAFGGVRYHVLRAGTGTWRLRGRVPLDTPSTDTTAET